MSSSTRRWAGPIVVAVVSLMVVSGFFYAVLRGRDARSDEGMGSFGGTAIELNDLSPPIAQLYRDVGKHDALFDSVPCFCGCDEGLGHRHLLDCFVMADGSGWESHATWCGVCQGEARMALRLLDRGGSVAEIRAQVIKEFGTPTGI